MRDADTTAEAIERGIEGGNLEMEGREDISA